eukprot:TRINITY_DN2231_c0_g1_i1.p2 TRINITY_DN2231_c0_g1~~TRINITY_DN2231_c0_g1_i1.p2  ORF type:complete len:235 (+),score=93.92 TRINITY_DN2231_c0_g1_i1:25-705(+)
MQYNLEQEFLSGLTQKVSMGTSIFAVTYKDGVIMGADSRTTTGSYIANRVSDKITEIQDKIYVCRSGSAADTQAISDYVKYYLEMHYSELGKDPRVLTAASIFQQICYNNKANLMAGIIVAGWDRIDGGSLYCIPLGGALVKEPYAVGGSGSSYIYGYCDQNYRPNMTREEAEKFVATGLALAMERDGSSGGVIRLVDITENGASRKMIPGNKLPIFYDEALPIAI